MDWRHLQPGDACVVRNGVGTDAAFDGRRVTFVRYTQPHGFAVVTFSADGAPVFLHPESLVKESSDGHPAV